MLTQIIGFVGLVIVFGSILNNVLTGPHLALIGLSVILMGILIELTFIRRKS